MRVESELKLTFDDVLIRPKRSVAPSRASVDLKREHRFRTRRSEAGWTGIPIIAANLDTTGTMKMAAVLHDLNMLTCLHKYYPLEELLDFFNNNPASFCCSSCCICYVQLHRQAGHPCRVELSSQDQSCAAEP